MHLRYEKTSGCSVGCTWLDFDVTSSIHGQWRKQTSSLSSQEYSYDHAGRLTLVKDSAAGQCTTRSYAYDADSNRTALTTRQPGSGGACDTTSPGATQTYSYDAGDRMLGVNTWYDDFGRIIVLGSDYSGGGTLNSDYYSNDLLYRQTQDGITNTYKLDAAQRQRERVQTGGANPGTEIYHYADGSDSPAWIQTDSGWTRNIAIGGNLAATQDNLGNVTLQLANLHGDIVATVSTDPNATGPTATFEFDEFGNPKSSASFKYGWLGGKQRRTELPSGVIQMGVRSYVPAMGRFTGPDPVPGGSANTYDYANQDPLTTFDLNGEAACHLSAKKKFHYNRRSGTGHWHFRATDYLRCTRAAHDVHAEAHISGIYFVGGVPFAIKPNRGPSHSCGDGGPKFSCKVEANTYADIQPGCGQTYPGRLTVVFRYSWTTKSGNEIHKKTSFSEGIKINTLCSGIP